MLRATAVVGVMLLALTACGGSPASPDESGRVEIELEEYAFNPDSIQLQAGEQVTFALTNTGEKEHELHIGRELAMMDGAPRGFQDNLFADFQPSVDPMEVAVGMDMQDMEGTDDEHEDEDGHEDEEAQEDQDMEDMDDEGGHEEHAEMVGFHVVLAPGETAEMSFTVPADAAGEWQLGCFEDDGAHWDDGMQGTLTVVES